MNIKSFCESIVHHDNLSICGLVKGDGPEGDYLVIDDRQNRAKFRIMASAILEHEWDVLEAILTGRREAEVLEHMTRIVGYYSKVKNWNKSKLSELRDRQAGDYSMESKSCEKAEKEELVTIA